MTYGPFHRHPRDMRGRYQDACRLAQWQVDIDEIAWGMKQITESLDEARRAVEQFTARWKVSA